MALRRTLAQLTTRVRQHLDEVAAGGFWSAEHVTAAINAAKDRVYLEVRKASQDYFVVTRASTDGSLTILGETYAASSFAIAPGTRDYTLPPDLVELRAIECITADHEQTRWSWRDASDPQFRSALGNVTPTLPSGFLYTLIGERTLRIAPLSDTALDLRLTYVAVLPDLEATSDTLEMPYPLHRAVEEYAAADCLMADRAPESAAFEARGNATVARFLGAHQRQSTDPQFVTGYLEDF
jgi:hypothetical protein